MPRPSIHQLAERHGVHRRTVRQALGNAVPPPRKQPAGRAAPKLGEYRALVDQWLEADKTAPRKQRHTARRIWQRLRDEHGADVGETTVRDYVRQRKREMGLSRQGFVPQTHSPGKTAEVDWGESYVVLAGQLTKVHVFMMRSCHSGASFAVAYPHETQQAFLEGHIEAFLFLGGVFGQVRYDNLASAVKKVLKGRLRVETDKFVGFRSHHMHESFFTLAGIEGAHEKGGIEGEIGRFRRRHLVPVPEVASIGELNLILRAACIKDLDRHVDHRTETIGEANSRERAKLRAMPEYRYVTYDVTEVRVDAKSLVCVRQNRYSVPCRLIGQKVQVRVHAGVVEVFSERRLVAAHERLGGRHGHCATLDHYLELLQHKPGALAGATALAQDRERGLWPAIYDELHDEITARHGPSHAARELVSVLMLCREIGPERVSQAVREALEAGAYDGQAVQVLARRADQIPAPDLNDLDPRLSGIGSPQPDLSKYDTLLNQGDNP
ncbi:MAG: IS21 family transposase [Thermoleophilia bacterium]|nr:IS21 family transposase [Thermoleophilia bacterium]